MANRKLIGEGEVNRARLTMGHRWYSRIEYLARTATPDNGAVIVELGSWQGKSSLLLAAGVLGKSGARIFCVDPFGEDESHAYQAKYYAHLAEWIGPIAIVYSSMGEGHHGLHIDSAIDRRRSQLEAPADWTELFCFFCQFTRHGCDRALGLARNRWRPSEPS